MLLRKRTDAMIPGASPHEATRSLFFERVAPFQRLAIIGTAKNVGKTTTLNAILAHGGATFGLTSVGRDGEATDMITERPKPRIIPPEGTLIATAKGTLSRATARLEKLATTPFRTALGPIEIHRVLSTGQVEIAGAVASYQASEVARLLEECGADKILIDGAIDRRASAAIADGVVLATGMSLLPDPAQVFDLTLTHCRMLSLGAPDIPIPPQENSGFRFGDRFEPVEESALAEDFPIPADADALSLKGAFAEGLAAKLLRASIAGRIRPFAVIVESGTHLVAGLRAFEDLRAAGFTFFARHPIALVAVTLNPTSPFGRGNPPEEFLARMRSLPVPVFDLCL